MLTEALIGERLFALAWNEHYTDDDVADIVAALWKVHAAYGWPTRKARR